MKLFVKHLTIKNIFSSLALMMSISFVQAGAVVVVGANSLIGSASKSDIVKIFLGKKKALPNVSVVPVDQEEGTAARIHFYKNTVKKSEAQIKSYWSRLIFTGKGQAPQIVGEDSDVKTMIASNPNLIGYIEESSLDDTVKVIYKP